MKIKFLTSILISSISLFSYAGVAVEKTDDFLWKNQETYLSNMNILYSGIVEINDNLTLCREEFYKGKSEEDKNSYMKATNDYSTNLLVTSSILSQSISELTKKMKEEKDVVLENLRGYSDTLEELVEKESKRNQKLLSGYEKTFTEINTFFCPTIIILKK
jgi:hydroxylamine reductase (hybrid-cluster protein)